MKTYREFLIFEELDYTDKFKNLKNSEIYKELNQKFTFGEILCLDFFEKLEAEGFPLDFIKEVFQKEKRIGTLILENELILYRKLYKTNKQDDLKYLDLKVLDGIIFKEDYVLYLSKLGFKKTEAQERFEKLQKLGIEYKIISTVIMPKKIIDKIFKELDELS